MSDFYTGCGRYLRLIAEGTNAPSFLELQKKFNQARKHRETCPQCIALNTPLAEQLFKAKVKVTDVDTNPARTIG